ncbi:MAG: 50S ribosomal protein L32 [bacterium]
MANPKYKTSRSKTRRRRANINLAIPNVVSCPKCHEPKLSHHICWSCGTYKDREAIKIDAAAKA